LVSGARSVRRFLAPPAVCGTWKLDQLQAMAGAYIATVTAFSAVNFTFLSPFVRWIWPAAIGSVVIALLRRRYEQRPVAVAPL